MKETWGTLALLALFIGFIWLMADQSHKCEEAGGVWLYHDMQCIRGGDLHRINPNGG